MAFPRQPNTQLWQSGFDEQIRIGLWTSPMSFRLWVEAEPE
jgi:hypothetical protein